MKLVIFDLDQTLVELTDVHDRVTRRTLKKVLGIDAGMSDVDYAGRTMTDSWHELARRRGISDEAYWAKVPEILSSFEADLPGAIPPDPAKYVLPGARELLEELSHTDNLVILYTGDSPGVARAILRAAGLEKYFALCFFGTEVAQRADMVRAAIKKAEESTGRQFQGKDVVIIGDSIRDVACGQVFGARTIAVATGFYSKEDLLATGPDHLVDSLRDYRAVLKLIQS